MTTQAQAASQMIAALRISDPELDTSVGTTTRKIIDAFAESLAEASIDDHLLTYQYDIDSKIGADLDDFVGLFGMARLPAKRASGVVTFSRSTESALTTSVLISVNTQVISATSPSITFQTVSGAYMEVGASTVDVPVQAVDPGVSGNVAGGTVTSISSPVAGVGSVTNMKPMQGGTDQESDTALRDRWKKTVFRNLAGTEQMYLGVALDDVDCYVANVVGSSKRRREQVQIVAGVGQTTVDDAAYVYTEPVFVGRNIDAGDINPRGFDYAWDTSVNPPKFDVLSSTNLPDDLLVEVDFEYQPLASRNAPALAITNRVDVWVGGQRAQAAVQSVIFRTSITFTNTALPTSDSLSRHKYVRSDGTKPDEDNIFVPLAWGPIISVPETISIAGATYGLADAVHPLGTEETVAGETIYYAYRVVHQDDAFGYTPTSRFGLEWVVDGAHPEYTPLNNATFSVGGQQANPYLYNKMIHDIQAAVDRWRLLGVDAKVHQAKARELRLSLAIMYSPKANQPTVNTAIDNALAAFLMGTGFQGRIQVSDLLQVIHNVSGVDNVRFLRGSDHTGYVSGNPNAYTVGIQRVIDGVVVESFVDADGRPYDIRMGDDEIPLYYGAHIIAKAENSFGQM